MKQVMKNCKTWIGSIETIFIGYFVFIPKKIDTQGII